MTFFHACCLTDTADGRPATTPAGARARVSVSSTPPVFASNGKLLVVSPLDSKSPRVQLPVSPPNKAWIRMLLLVFHDRQGKTVTRVKRSANLKRVAA
jgi:hypothetical protein